MPAARGSRRVGIVAASVAGHAVLVTLLVLHAPRLRVVETPAGPPEPIIPILIMPRTPPAPSAAPGQPTQIRLHRRQTRFSEPPPPVAPLVAPERLEAAQRPSQSPGPKTLTLPSTEDALAANARNALRSRRNCDDPALSRSEREACQERAFANGRDAPTLGLGIEANKAAGLAATAAQRERDYKYMRAPPPAAWNGAPSVGASPAELGKVVGSDNVTKKIPF